MQILSGSEWARLKTALNVARSGTGRPLADERKTVEAIIWRQRNGARWRAAPAAFGPGERRHSCLSAGRERGSGSASSRFCTRGDSPSLAKSFSTAQAPAPITRRRAQKGADAHALGRSRGGYGTKVCAVCGAHGRPLGFALIPGQASQPRVAPALLLLAAWLGTIRRVVCDAACASAAWFALVVEAGGPCQPDTQAAGAF